MDTPSSQEPQKKDWSLLAREEFGSDFYGEVKEEQPIAQESEEFVESEQDTAQEESENPENSVESSEETPIGSIDELVKHYEFDPEWMDSLEVPVKINGETGKAKLSDLKASYQIQEAANERLREAKEKARAEMRVVAEKRDQLQGQFAIAASLIDKAEKNLSVDESKINWADLRVNDPAEWSAKKEEFKQRKDEIESLKREAVGAYQSTMSVSKQEAEAQQQQYLQEQAQKLVEKLPEWKDPDTAKTEKTAVAEYLINQGFTQEDIAGASDHRMIVLARKAMLFDKGSNKAEVVQKKIAKIPKVLKPGTPKSTEQSSREELARLKSRAQKSGDIDAAVAYLRRKRG